MTASSGSLEVRTKVRLSVLIVGVLATGYSGAVAPSFSDLSGPYLGQQPPGLEPVPFAERLIAFTHSSLSISPDGTEIYWADRAAGPIQLEVPMKATGPSQCPFRMDSH
jgi:hypothetical protein